MRIFYFRRLLPVIAMMLASVTAASAYDFISDSIYYNITSSTDLTVDVTYGDTSSNSYSGAVTIPSTVTNNGTTYTVTGIGVSAFKGSSGLTSVTIGDRVTVIGYDAFYECTSLASVTMGKNVTSIGRSAFSHCTSLTGIEVPDSVTSIGRSAFYECTSLASIEIPDDVDSIPYCTFYKCTSLASVTIGKNVTSIGRSAFSHCTSLTGIEIPNSVTTLGDNAFYECTSLASIEIPASVTSIGESAFYECTSLASIVIPDDVDSIPYCTFYKCTSLASVTMGKNVTSIGRSAFSHCTSLTGIEVPDSVTSIGMGAFYECTKLASIEIPDDVDNIPYCAFYKCTSLASVTMGEGVTSIGESAFSHCTSLTGIEIPASVTSIGRSAFYECTSLQRMTMPEGITELGDSIFYNCSALKDVTIPAHLTENAYSTYVVGCDSINSVTINGSGEIGTSAFKNCTTLTTLTIGDSVTAIGDSAFYGCSSLASVTIPNSVTSIGTHAFCRCTSLTSIEIPDSVTSIGKIAFSRCSSLESIEIPNSVTTLGDNAFYYCTSLASVTIGSGLTSIERSTFYNCTSLTSVTIGKSVKSIGLNAFYKCTGLRSIYCLMEDASSVECGDSVFLWYDNGVKDYTIVRNAVLFVPDEGALETYREADNWSDFTRVAVTRYMDKDEEINAGDELNIYTTTNNNDTTYAVVTFGSKNASDVWAAAEEENTLDVVGPFSNYVKGKVVATNEDGGSYDPTSEDNNTFDAPIAGAYLMMEPKADGTIYVAVKKQGDVYVCDETGAKVDYLMAELPNGVFECYGSSSEETDTTDTEETSESESASSTEETDSCIRYSFPALAGKTYFVTSTNGNCLSVAGYAFEPDSLEAPFAANTLTISDSSEDNLEESDTITTGQYDVTLNRSFTKGGWTSMVLPFSVSPSMLNETFGDSTAIIYFNRVSSDTLYLTEHYHDMIVAGTPMFIRPDTTATSLTFKCVTYGEPAIEIENDTLGTYSVTSLTLPSIEDNIIGCENNKSDWELKASYVSVQGEENDSTHYYMIGFKYETDTIMVADENGDSIEKENTVMKNYFFEYEKVMSIKGLRAWLEDITEDNSAARLITVSRNGIIDDDDTETTGIINALTGNSGTVTATRRSNSGNGNIYNLHGQMVRHASEGTSGLPQGIYIVNGKKIIVE